MAGRFEPRPLDEDQAALVGDICLTADLFEDLLGRTESSRETSLALTNLEQAVMWAIKSIAVNGLDRGV